MISLDQVLLLQQKVESAVAKIQQLQAENDALRTKCSELTNALSSKTEQLSTIEVDQNQIENGIRKALDRLNQIENSVLKTVGQVTPNTNPNVQIVQTAVVEKATPIIETPVQNTVVPQSAAAVTPNPVQTATISTPVNQGEPVLSEERNIPNFQNMQSAPVYNASQEVPVQDNFSLTPDVEEENPDEELGFDIF